MILCYLLLRNTVNNMNTVVLAVVAVAADTLDLGTSLEKSDDIRWIRTSH
jgi:hypothetical protein